MELECARERAQGPEDSRRAPVIRDVSSDVNRYFILIVGYTVRLPDTREGVTVKGIIDSIPMLVTARLGLSPPPPRAIN